MARVHTSEPAAHLSTGLPGDRRVGVAWARVPAEMSKSMYGGTPTPPTHTHHENAEKTV